MNGGMRRRTVACLTALLALVPASPAAADGPIGPVGPIDSIDPMELMRTHLDQAEARLEALNGYLAQLGAATGEAVRACGPGGSRTVSATTGILLLPWDPARPAR